MREEGGGGREGGGREDPHPLQAYTCTSPHTYIQAYHTQYSIVLSHNIQQIVRSERGV